MPHIPKRRLAPATVANLRRSLEGTRARSELLAAQLREESRSIGWADLDRSDLLDDDAPDGGVLEHLRDVHERLAREAEQLLRETEEALARLDDGTYGLCTRCSQPIPVARLRAVPSASTCVPCKDLASRPLAAVVGAAR